MEINSTVGMMISGIAVISGFATVIIKITRPINDLNLNIVRLTAAIAKLTDNDKRQDERIACHGKQIDDLCLKAESLEERIRAMEKWCAGGRT